MTLAGELVDLIAADPVALERLRQLDGRGAYNVSDRRELALAPVPRLLLTRDEAAAALGMSLDTFERHVQPHVRIIRVGRLRLVYVGDLEDWARAAGESAVEPLQGSRVRSVPTQSGPAAGKRSGPGTRGTSSHAP